MPELLVHTFKIGEVEYEAEWDDDKWIVETARWSPDGFAMYFNLPYKAGLGRLRAATKRGLAERERQAKRAFHIRRDELRAANQEAPIDLSMIGKRERGLAYTLRHGDQKLFFAAAVEAYDANPERAKLEFPYLTFNI